MTRCWCEGRCAICDTGDVMNHLCDHCEAEYCSYCHGVINDHSGILDVCECEIDYTDVGDLEFE